MPLSEFDIIKQCFASRSLLREDVRLGIGDDAALIAPPVDMELVIAVDTLVAGVHFPEQTSAGDIAHKALAVNLSDLAAMGATPAWFTLALTLPESNQAWLNDFADGLFALANRYEMQLVGGDTTRGPLCVTIQVAGYVPAGKALRRDGAKAGDAVFVTGTLGDAAAGLQAIQAGTSVDPALVDQLNRPNPRIEIGLALRGLASACIDLSDGLQADLGHILAASDLGAQLQLDQLAFSKPFIQATENKTEQIRLALSGGDDYELCFCIAEANIPAMEQHLKSIPIAVTRIGRLNDQQGLSFFIGDENYQPVWQDSGYQHFKHHSNQIK